MVGLTVIVVVLAAATCKYLIPLFSMHRMAPYIWILSTDCVIVGVATPIKRGLGCPDGLHCGPGPECTIDTCDFAGCAKASICSNIKERQLPCPPGLNCGHGPQCTPFTCGLPGCRDLPMCAVKSSKGTSNTVHHPCPQICDEFGHCGCNFNTTIPGKLPTIECTATTCHLPGCAAAPVCVSQPIKSIKQVPVEISPTNSTGSAIPGKLPKLECTPISCHLPGCAASEVCVKHTNVTDHASHSGNAAPTVIHPCPDVCDEDGHCGCDYEAAHGKVKRFATNMLNHPCPLICNEQGQCGCNYQPLKEKRAAAPETDRFCPLICDEEGRCGCNYGGRLGLPPA